MLAVDIGNTHVRLAAFAGGEIQAGFRLRTAGLEAGELVRRLAEPRFQAAGRVAWVASVAPAAEAAAAAGLREAGLEVRFIRSGEDYIIPLALNSPRAAGVDRLLAALAAGARHFPVEEWRQGFAVVQCGSAVTVDIVDGGGVFRGGHILPGPEMWLSGLARAALVPDYSAEPPDWENRSPGTDTREAVRRGLAAGLPAAVISCLRTLLEWAGVREREGRLPAVFTGGWGGVAARLAPGCPLDGALLLHGIRIFARRAEEGGRG